ncbi:hypothetical protein ACGC1H_000464 [Rhizoctonia solani]
MPAPGPVVRKPAPVKAASKSKAAASSATTSKAALPDVDTAPTPVKKPPFAKAKSKPEPKATSSNTSDSALSDPAPIPPPAPALATKPAPFAKSTSKPAPTPSDPSKPAIKPAPFKTKRPTFTESADSSDEEHEEPKPKRHKRRKSHVEPTSKSVRKPRPSLPAQSTPGTKTKSKLEPTSGPLELRPASFLTRTGSLSFMSKPAAPLTGVNVPAGDVWSYDDLTGLTWVKLDVRKCEIVPGNEQTEQRCWWPAEVTQNTSNGLKLCLCGLGIERELGPDVAAETNVLVFRKPNISSVRFPTFKTAFLPLVEQVQAISGSGEPSAGEPSNQPTGGPSSRPAGEPPAESPPILPTSPSALEALWKQALTRAFEIDTESNDGLVDIHLLFSQKSQSSREEDELSGNTALDEQEQSEDEEDILENGTTVLCRYRTRYYPAKIIAYHPREGKAKRRAGAKGKYKCRFADDSTKIATRQEIMTSLDNGFVTCPLGSYQQYTSQTHQKPSGVREPSPAPRAHSPAPEPDETQIDPEEYCSRERMRDQLRPVLPFLKGLIERTYVPGKGIVDGSESLSNPDAPLHNPAQAVLDRHAIFMQGGRARKNLAYSVHTGDLNEDDCEELMFEISRWALRGERWACQEGVSQEVEDATNQAVENATNQGGREGEAMAQVAQEGESTGEESGEGASGVIPKDENANQDVQMAGEPDAKVGANSQEPEHKEIAEDTPPQPQAKSGDSTELEDEPLKVVRILEKVTPSVHGDFRSLVKLQPPRPIGASDYEELTPEERMGYVSDVLYPEAAALILSYRRGIRTQPGPLADPVAEHALYTAGLQAAKNTCSAFDWVEQILSVRQLRSANSKYQVEDQAQVVVAGGTKSRPKYMTSVLK